MSGEGVDVSLVTAEEEFEKAVKTRDTILYRNAVGRAFLSMVITVNFYIYRKLNAKSKSH